MSNGIAHGGTIGNLVVSAISRFGDRPAIADEMCGGLIASLATASRGSSRS